MKSFSLLAALVFASVLVRAQGDFIPPQQHNSSVVGITSGQTARLNVLYPSIPAPLMQVMCGVTVSIVDDQGGVLKTQDFLLLGGKSVSLSLDADTELPGHAAQIHALTLTRAAVPGGYCEVLPSLDIVDKTTGKTVLHLETTITYPRAVIPTLVRGRL